jgi:hypothetical protein
MFRPLSNALANSLFGAARQSSDSLGGHDPAAQPAMAACRNALRFERASSNPYLAASRHIDHATSASNIWSMPVKILLHRPPCP